MRRGQHHRGAVRHAGQIAQHHPEAVIERHRNAKPVAVSEAHPLTHPEAVVEEVVVSEHRAFGEAGGARGVLDIDDIVKVQ